MESITLTVTESFRFSEDSLTVITFEPGEHQVSMACAEYAARKGRGTYEGCPDPFVVPDVPLGKQKKDKGAKKKS